MSEFTSLAQQSVFDPRAAARRILLAGVAREHHWTIFLLVICLSGALSSLTLLVMPPPEGMAAPSGLVVASLVGASILVLTAMVQLAGRFFGGTGRVQDAMILVLWLQFLMVVLQAVQLVLALVLPGTGGPLALLALALMLWILTNFAAELHGWDTVAGTFAKLVVTLLGLSVVLSVVLALLLSMVPS